MIKASSLVITTAQLADTTPNSSPSTQGISQKPSSDEPALIGWEDLDAELKELFAPKTSPTESPVPVITQPPEATLNERWLPVFDSIELWQANWNAKNEAKSYESMRSVFDAASSYEGCREIPLFNRKMLVLQLEQLALEMPNFAPVIDYLLAEFGLVLTGNVKDFRIEPLLLVGAPGLGKTRFVGQLATILGIQYEKISAGTLQTSADLSGTSRVWSNTRPGRIARLMAESQEACPIVLLDEIDKLSHSGQYPVTPVLLELLEHDSAKTFRDECLEIRFDVSRMIHVATANELDLIDAPIRSRFRVIEIKSPDSAQRRAIIENVLKEIIRGRDFEVEPAVIDSVAEIDSDLRELRRYLRESVGRALLNEERRLQTHHLNFRNKSVRQRIGFI